MLKISVILLFIHLQAVKATRPDTITFPKNDDFNRNCTLSNGQPGVCRSLVDCGTALNERKVRPKTCYFEGSEQFVCCRVQRPAEIACTDFTTPRPEVTNGLPTEANEFPFMVALGWATPQSNVYEYKCGGALISHNWVLTAAHCASVGGDAPVVVLPGGVNLTNTEFKPTQIEKVVVHPKYEPTTAYDDIALIKLKSQPGETQPACIADHLPLVNQNATAIGYGDTVFGGRPSDQLLKAYLSTVDTFLCQFFFADLDALPNGLMDTHLCAKDLQFNRDTCQGDSGGPLVLHIPNEYESVPYIIGVTSFGLGCATNSPGIYTNVAKYLDWIEPIIWPQYSLRKT
ncbi:serine protease snake-like [Rhagoletis pomonella]|uniref:serine protease snake-like n=1 Tax=Rhagoletis pomonella TaxID=28610 RepID=UPI0017817807|nr:serine protease snake-like [Rhagoletis pomonella]